MVVLVNGTEMQGKPMMDTLVELAEASATVRRLRAAALGGGAYDAASFDRAVRAERHARSRLDHLLDKRSHKPAPLARSDRAA